MYSPSARLYGLRRKPNPPEEGYRLKTWYKKETLYDNTNPRRPGMKKLKIADGIHMLTMNVDNILFEGMWELANGVTLNSYIVQGDKTAIIDGVIGWDGALRLFTKA